MDLILGVTGGSGCGKSAFCRELEACGAHIIDADMVAREVVRPGREALIEIEKSFGSGYILENGELDRKKLGEAVFSNPAKLQELTDITHKYIIKEIKEEISGLKGGLCLIDAPLLFESGLDKVCARTVCVLAEREIRINRIKERDCLTEKAAAQRIDAQKPDSFYKEQCDDVILNNGTHDELREATQKYWRKLEKEYR